MEMTFETVPYRRNPDCPVCGENPIDSVEGIEYTDACAVSVE
jgi:adenylyltransferase/sulfurtransferase